MKHFAEFVIVLYRGSIMISYAIKCHTVSKEIITSRPTGLFIMYIGTAWLVY